MLNTTPSTSIYAPPLQRPVAIASLVHVPAGRSSAKFRSAPTTKAACADCAMRRVCMSSELEGPDLARFEDLARTTRQIKAGAHLYRSGDESLSLYAVRSGFIKTSTVTDDGREQVTGFHMLGEIIGLDMIGGGIYANAAIALEDSNVCEISLSALEKLSHDVPMLQRKLYNMIGARFRHEREALLLLGTMRAEDRVASFLLNIGQRYASRGFSQVRFVLRMSRAEIGSYLGLRLETVSRLFSKFQTEGLLRVDNRFVEILDPEGLKVVIGRSVH